MHELDEVTSVVEQFCVGWWKTAGRRKYVSGTYAVPKVCSCYDII